MEFTDGDILAFRGADLSSRLISAVTAWPFGPRELRIGPSHVGIVLGGKLFEATSFCKSECVIQRKVVSGAQAHVIGKRVADYRLTGGSVSVWRLQDLWRFDDREFWYLHQIASDWCHDNRGYDFSGAGLSGTRLLSRLPSLFPKANLDSLFCSELVASLLMRVGRMPVANPATLNPARMLRRLVSSGVYRHHHTYPKTAVRWYP